jgi:hypothetical protein
MIGHSLFPAVRCSGSVFDRVECSCVRVVRRTHADMDVTHRVRLPYRQYLERRLDLNFTERRLVTRDLTYDYGVSYYVVCDLVNFTELSFFHAFFPFLVR